MSAPHSPEPAPDDTPGRQSAAPPRDFSDLAKRISSRTTDLFAIGLMLVVLLAVGVQVTQWWRADPPAAPVGPVAGGPLAVWDDPADLNVEFSGGPWNLKRSTVTGAVEQITNAALQHARSTLESFSPVDLPPPDPAEQQWLQQLRDWPPQQETERGQVYLLPGPWPWIVATQSAFMGTGESRNPSHAADAQRVICWAFALPQSPQRWTLYTAVRAGGAATGATVDNVVLPSKAEPLLTVHSKSGGLTTFRTEQSLRVVRDDWNRKLTADGWHQQTDWTGNHDIQRAAYVRRTTGSAERLDAALMHDPNGPTTGLADWRQE